MSQKAMSGMYRGYATSKIRLSFRTRYEKPDHGSYGAIDSHGSWDGVIGSVAANRADVGLNVIDFEISRLEVVDYFPPVWNLR
jgi:hypothetical protein